jgi:hypothetical protein
VSEELDQLAREIAQAKDLPLEAQPEAFEAIRLRLESMIADSRPQQAE